MKIFISLVCYTSVFSRSGEQSDMVKSFHRFASIQHSNAYDWLVDLGILCHINFISFDILKWTISCDWLLCVPNHITQCCIDTPSQHWSDSILSIFVSWFILLVCWCCHSFMFSFLHAVVCSQVPTFSVWFSCFGFPLQGSWDEC